MPAGRPDDRGVVRRPVFPFSAVLLGVVIATQSVISPAAVEPFRPGQIEEVRRTIQGLEANLASLDTESESVRSKRERIALELGLAEARVEELELILTQTRNEIVALKDEVTDLGAKIEQRKGTLAAQLELIALLGRPGPLQLMWDGARGGGLEDTVSMVVAMTAGQARIVEEFLHLRSERAGRLTVLSLALERAGAEARELVHRREQLQSLRREADSRLAALDRQREATGDRIADLRERQQALERLFKVVGEQRRFTGKDDIRRFRGALPWPAAGTVRRTFGKHFVARYATYTVCNGVRLAVDRGATVHAVFPGQVAYARHFRGYGNMVVVDHGGGVFSLVAGLGSIQVRLDQQVDMGTQLGLAGPETEDGNLYFEIRVGGEPDDPRRWLQLSKGK